jgi:hypothetical protein
MNEPLPFLVSEKARPCEMLTPTSMYGLPSNFKYLKRQPLGCIDRIHEGHFLNCNWVLQGTFSELISEIIYYDFVPSLHHRSARTFIESKIFWHPPVLIKLANKGI